MTDHPGREMANRLEGGAGCPLGRALLGGPLFRARSHCLIAVRAGPRFSPGPSTDLDVAAITIRGDNLTVDFGGAELMGTPGGTLPDQRAGTAIRVEGRNVTIRNVCGTRLQGWADRARAAWPAGARLGLLPQLEATPEQYARGRRPGSTG